MTRSGPRWVALARPAGGGAPAERRLLPPPIRAMEHQVFFRDLAETVGLVYRTDVCAHLRLRSGRGATPRNEGMVRSSLAAGNHWQLGQTVKPQDRPPFKVVGIYRVPNTRLDYWYARGSTYFPAEIDLDIRNPAP